MIVVSEGIEILAGTPGTAVVMVTESKSNLVDVSWNSAKTSDARRFIDDVCSDFVPKRKRTK